MQTENSTPERETDININIMALIALDYRGKAKSKRENWRTTHLAGKNRLE